MIFFLKRIFLLEVLLVLNKGKGRNISSSIINDIMNTRKYTGIICNLLPILLICITQMENKINS